MRLTNSDVMSGYPSGATRAEPCDDQNRPYYRTDSNVTRAQMSKCVDIARKAPGTSNLASPIAYAFIIADSTVASGTPNVSATYNDTSERIEISIAGEP